MGDNQGKNHSTLHHAHISTPHAHTRKNGKHAQRTASAAGTPGKHAKRAAHTPGQRTSHTPGQRAARPAGEIRLHLQEEMTEEGERARQLEDTEEEIHATAQSPL